MVLQITSIRWHLDPAQSSSFHQGSQLLCCKCNSLLCNHHHHQLTPSFDLILKVVFPAIHHHQSPSLSTSHLLQHLPPGQPLDCLCITLGQDEPEESLSSIKYLFHIQCFDTPSKCQIFAFFF